jgi:hypothetical protein
VVFNPQEFSVMRQDKTQSKANKTAQQDKKNGLSEEQLEKVSGGSFDIEQTLNIGSQSTGAGAGKVTFNPFSNTRK